VVFSEYALGSAVRYENVKEVFVGGAKSYEIKRYFKDFGSTIESQNLGTLVKPRSFENYALGMLVKEERFDNNNKLLQKTVHDYKTLSPAGLGLDGAVARVTKSVFVGGRFNGVLCEHQVQYTEYPILTRWLAKTSVKDSIYYKDGYVSTNTEYFYDNSNHKQVTRTEVTDSKGRIIKTQTIYPQDIAAANRTATEQKLIDQHQIALHLSM